MAAGRRPFHPKSDHLHNGETGYPGQLTTLQQTALDQIQQLVPPELIADRKILGEHDETFYLRFLRARKFNLEDTKQMLDDHIAWSRSSNLSELRNTPVEAVLGCDVNLVNICYPRGYHGFDRFGRPLYIKRPGKIDTKGLFKVTTLDAYLRYEIQHLELFMRMQAVASARTGYHMESSVSIIDLEGLGFAQINKTTLDFVKSLSALASAHYPETLHRMFVINAPAIFTTTWSMIRVWLDERTKAKINILGGRKDYLPLVSEYVHPRHLPAEMGGQCTLHGGDCWGQLGNDDMTSMQNLPTTPSPAPTPAPTAPPALLESKQAEPDGSGSDSSSSSSESEGEEEESHWTPHAHTTGSQPSQSAPHTPSPLPSPELSPTQSPALIASMPATAATEAAPSAEPASLPSAAAATPATTAIAAAAAGSPSPAALSSAAMPRSVPPPPSPPLSSPINSATTVTAANSAAPSAAHTAAIATPATTTTPTLTTATPTPVTATAAPASPPSELDALLAAAAAASPSGGAAWYGEYDDEPAPPPRDPAAVAAEEAAALAALGSMFCRERLILGRGRQHELRVPVGAGDTVSWECSTVKRDISFLVSFDGVVMKPIQRYATHATPLFGQLTAPRQGLVVLTWSNEYSYVNDKDLSYVVWVLSAAAAAASAASVAATATAATASSGEAATQAFSLEGGQPVTEPPPSLQAVAAAHLLNTTPATALLQTQQQQTGGSGASIALGTKPVAGDDEAGWGRACTGGGLGNVAQGCAVQ